MQDNTLIALVISTLIAGEAAAGIPGTPIAQAFQPTMEGTNSVPTAYLHKIGDRRYGFLARNDVWNQTSSTLVHTEDQKYETTFQLSFLATQNPTTPTQLTASDFLNLCAAILQSDVAIATFQAAGAGIERITDVRNAYFTDDRQQYEALPSFDFIMVHDQIITTTTPVLESVEIDVYAI